jgi:hypothetical protein
VEFEHGLRPDAEIDANGGFVAHEGIRLLHAENKKTEQKHGLIILFFCIQFSAQKKIGNPQKRKRKRESPKKEKEKGNPQKKKRKKEKKKNRKKKKENAGA